MGTISESKKKPSVIMYTDGSARGNPGNGGYGTVLITTKPDGTIYRSEFSGGYRLTTNNRMEMMAVIAGFEVLKKPCDVTVYSDSQYIVNAFNKNWLVNWVKKDWMKKKNDPVKNVDLWQRMLVAMWPHSVTFKWVKGHDGNIENECCDRLAVSAAESGKFLDDTGFVPEIQ